MNVFLMHRDRDFYPQEGWPPNAADLTQDLELQTLFGAMAAEDKFLLEVAKDAVLASLHEPEAILYRQHILADCLDRPDIVREMYALAVEAIEGEKKGWGLWWGMSPDSLLSRSVELLGQFVGLLRRLRHIADEHGVKFQSAGFARLFAMFRAELDDNYLNVVEDHLRRLKFRSGAVMTAELGKGNQGTNYILRKPRDTRQGWIERLQSWIGLQASRNRASYFFELDDRDEAGFRALSELRGQGIRHVAIALAQSNDHILNFFSMLRLELGFMWVA